MFNLSFSPFLRNVFNDGLSLFPFKSPKVEFSLRETSSCSPLFILKVLLKFSESTENNPTAAFPTVNFEPVPKLTLVLVFPSETIPIVVPAFTPVPLSAISIGAFIFNIPSFLAYIPTALVPTLILFVPAVFFS